MVSINYDTFATGIFVIFVVYRSGQKLERFWHQKRVDENDSVSGNVPEGGLEGSMMCDVTEGTENSHHVTHLPHAYDSIQNHEGTPGD